MSVSKARKGLPVPKGQKANPGRPGPKAIKAFRGPKARPALLVRKVNVAPKAPVAPSENLALRVMPELLVIRALLAGKAK